MDDWSQSLRRRYQRVRILGHGAFGEVCDLRLTHTFRPRSANTLPTRITPLLVQVVLALDRSSGHQVAIKRIFLRTGCEAPALREARALQAVAHPNIISLLEVHAEVCWSLGGFCAMQQLQRAARDGICAA